MLSKACSFLPLVENQLCFLSSILSKAFGGNDFWTFIKSIYYDLRAVCPTLFQQNRTGRVGTQEAGREGGQLPQGPPPQRGSAEATQKSGLVLQRLTVRTSELPPRRPPCPNFEKSVQIWEMDAVGNCTQNYQAQVILFKVPIRSQKIPAALFWSV